MIAGAIALIANTCERARHTARNVIHKMLTWWVRTKPKDKINKINKKRRFVFNEDNAPHSNGYSQQKRIGSRPVGIFLKYTINNTRHCLRKNKNEYLCELWRAHFVQSHRPAVVRAHVHLCDATRGEKKYTLLFQVLKKCFTEDSGENTG